MSVDKALRDALNHLEQGNWDAAHTIVQNDDSAAGAWVHAIVHVMEGDLDNARYWYGRAGRAFSADLKNEIAVVKKSI